MKKLILFIAPLFLFASCVKESTEYKKLKAQNDSLVIQKKAKDAEINNYFKTINEISENFDKVTASEQLISATTHKPERLSSQAAQSIKDNIVIMTNALQKNREQIALLQQKIKKSGLHYAELQKTIDRLTADLQEKAQAMDSLKAELGAKDKRIFELGQQVNDLDKDNKQKAELIKQQADELNAAFYVFGTTKELKAQKILTKNGIFSQTKVLQADFNKDYFVKIDIRTTTSIPVYSKKAKIKTNHPLTSYTIATENGNKVIQIKDPVQFWSVSKYLVVQTN
jgi:chromosome segregation ATPase